MKPPNHLQGEGCRRCGYTKVSEKNKSNLESFISKANKIHNHRYDYSKAVYELGTIKTCIICPIHGEFWQTPNSHLSGSGCPRCRMSKGELQVEQYLIDNKINYIQQYPIPINQSINPSGFAYIDFYLPDYNIFIEYNGRQHYVSVERFGGELRLEQQTQRDNYIKNYSKNKGINLVEIKYDQDESIAKIIENAINIYR